jgi:outer membrane protein OmpA-like peptidoglycan-associated protein
MNIWTTKLRGPGLPAALATACIAFTPAHAAERTKASRQENTGVATGFAIGAAAGGPIGAVVGATAGALLGDHYHRQSVSNASLKTNLSQSESDRSRLQTELARSEAQEEQMSHALDQTRELETEVSFRTADASLPDPTLARLKKLGALAASLPEVTVRVSGYADPRGSEELNAQLSRQRAEAVAKAIEDAGVDSSRVIIEAHGESQSQSSTGDLDGYAFDRRVTVRIEHAAESTVASR